MLRGISLNDIDKRGEEGVEDLANRAKALMNGVSVENWVKAIRSIREER
jgi:hypothetical protein